MIPIEQGRKDTSWEMLDLRSGWYGRYESVRGPQSNFHESILVPFFWNVLYLGVGMVHLSHELRWPCPATMWQVCYCRALRITAIRSNVA
jgi:hypothetical protein